MREFGTHLEAASGFEPLIEVKLAKTRSDTEREEARISGLFLFEHITECYGLSPEVGTFLERFLVVNLTPRGLLLDTRERLEPPAHAVLRGTARLYKLNPVGFARAL